MRVQRSPSCKLPPIVVADDSAPADTPFTPRSPILTSRKVIVVANRLPTSVHVKPGGQDFTITSSAGGLVSALNGVSGLDSIWMGWPGGEVPKHLQQAVTEKCAEERNVPIFLDAKTIDYFYNGFCNNILWPLFHYVPPPMDFGSAETPQEEFQFYIRANEIFTDAIVRLIQQQDPHLPLPYVWVHDYHLMLIPQMLRKRCPELKIGWFLHTPWPTHEVFRMLPFRTEILHGLLSADLLAFHVYDYQRHFMHSCEKLLGLEGCVDGIDATPLGGSIVKCTSIPIGIEPMKFVHEIKTQEVKDDVTRMRKQYGVGRKVILGVDRLDYMKGIPHKLNAFDRFLEMYPDWRGKVVLVQLAVPSRSSVPEYQKLKSAVHEIVGKINGRRGHLGFLPVHYLDQSLAFRELVALYRIADVAFISSLRDGMNLVAFEYVATQKGRHGVLALSEFAGAAQSLGAGAVRINPWNPDQCAMALHEALTMAYDERRSRHDYCFRHVLGHTSQRWAEMFLETLFEASEEIERAQAAVPPLLKPSEVALEMREATSRLIMIEVVDGLIGGRGHRGLSVNRFKSLVHIPDRILKALHSLSVLSDTLLVLSSALSQEIMERLFRQVPQALLIADKGTTFRKPGEDKWSVLVTPAKFEQDTGPWMTDATRILERVQRQTPGSFISRGVASISWSWEDLQPEIGQSHAHDLIVHLWAGPLADVPHGSVDVSLGSRFVEIRPTQYSRDKLLRCILSETCGSSTFDFGICLGHYEKIEETVYGVFETFVKGPFHSVTVTRSGLSRATERLPTAEAVQQFLMLAMSMMF